MDIRRLIALLIDTDDHARYAADIQKLVETVDGLDQWLSRGGVPPKSWV
jgi:hypothetical protein